MGQTAICTAKVAPRTLLWWCLVTGVLRVWVSDTAKHFRNSALRVVAEQVGVDCRFSLVKTAWTNGTVKRVLLESV